MNPGKVSNSILKRSVLKLLKSRNEHVEKKPAIGADCASIKLDQDQKLLSSVSCGEWTVYRVANNIAACGGKAVAAECCVLMPVDFDERALKNVIRELDAECESLHMQIAGGHTQVSAAVNRPVVTVTGIGHCDSNQKIGADQVRPDQDIILTKWIGIGGIRKIAELKEREILKTFLPEVLEKAVGQREDLSVAPEAEIAVTQGVVAMHDVAEGGIYAALWDMAEAGQVGLDVEFRKIPVKQEVIEVCELFDVNPYELDSTGCLLMTSENGYDIVKLLLSNGIAAQIIGRTTADHARIIRNQDEIRYLDTPSRDELYRFLSGNLVD